MTLKNIVVFLCYCMTVLPLSAQEGPEPTEPLTQAEWHNSLDPQMKAEMEADIREMTERTIFDLRVGYLYGEGALAEDSLISPSAFQEQTAAVLITSQEQLLEAWETEDFDGFFVHVSALEWLDVAWTQAAYREHVMLSGFNLQHAQMAELTGDQCLYRENERYRFSDDGLFYIAYAYYIEAPEVDDRAFIHEAELVSCDGFSSDQTIHLQHGVFQYEFSTPEELDWIISGMVGDSVNYDKPRRAENHEEAN